MSDHSPSFERAANTTGASPSLTPSPDPSTDSRRRDALRYLARFEYPVELRTLAAHVAAARENVPVETVTDDERERLAIELHHVDVPKLVADGVVDYDPESRMVVYAGVEDDGVGRYADAGDRARSSDAA